MSYLTKSRSPSWGAWIEIIFVCFVIIEITRRSPSWGAWIEIARLQPCGTKEMSLPLVGSVD